MRGAGNPAFDGRASSLVAQEQNGDLFIVTLNLKRMY
jgi:hypothetical protein